MYRLAGALSTTPRRVPCDVDGDPVGGPLPDTRPMTETGKPENGKSIVLVGLMGAGKSSVGTRLAKRLGLAFQDADAEIVKAAGCSIEDIFAIYGESAFRDGERRVIARLLGEEAQVMATGGGAFIDPKTRQAIKRQAISVWLRADLDILVERTGRRDDRPILKKGDPRQILEDLIAERYPVYAEADIIVDTGEEPPDFTVDQIVESLAKVTESAP